jgi:uncharacterized protein (DUF58 family)
MNAARRRVFPLLPRRRFVGAPFGDRRSPRRGSGDEVAGSRPYHPGDRIAAIDWKASARLSAARGTEEFVVREYFAEESLRVAIVCDRRPAMQLYGPRLPWLDKAAVLTGATELVAASAHAARAELAYVDFAEGAGFWLSPARRAELDVRRRLAERPLAAPADGVERSLKLLSERADVLPPGTFVFVVSDFLTPIAPAAWLRARRLRWDVIPVVIQDAVWEQSFPDVAGVVVPFADPATGRPAPTLLTRRAARERAAANARRLESLLTGFRRLGFDPVLLSSERPDEIAARFHAWSRRRRLLLRRSA